MKISQIFESTDNKNRSVSNEEIMNSFIDHARSLSVRGKQLLLGRMQEIGNQNWGWDIDMPTDDILDPRVLISTIGSLANELQDDQDFNALVTDFLELDETNPPG